MPRLLVALTLAIFTSAAVADELVLEPISVKVGEDGLATIPLSAPGGPRNYLVVAGSLGTTGAPIRLVVSRRQPVKAGEIQSVETDLQSPSEWWRWRVDRDRTVMERARRSSNADERWSAAKFAQTKSFHLFTGEDDLFDARRYVSVRANLRKVGKHCTVYVGEESDVPTALVDEVIRVFDERVYPSARQTFGEHRDVDRNGKLTILMTSWLGRLSGGKVSLSGFVRGADFYRDVEAPFSNQCDMLYLNSNLQPGPHLTTIIAHEYTHAITFCEHVFGEYLPGGQGRDDEAWLSEAVAHVAENMHGDGWSNLDYRVSTYLSQPNRYRLVVPDYFHEGLWRCHGSRGATYLFLRYCVDRFGEGVLKELSQSNLNGIENIETATQTTFADLFRGWSTSTSVASFVGAPPDRQVALEGRMGSRLLAGVQPVEIGEGGMGREGEGGQEVAVELAPTSWACLKTKLRAGESTRLHFEAPPGSDLQLTLIRLPDDLADARMWAEPANGSTVSLVLSSDKVVHWEHLSWERLQLPLQGCDETAKSATIVDASANLSIDESNPLRAHSSPIDHGDAAESPVVFKALGRDAQGRPVSAWTVVDPSSPTPHSQLPTP